MEKVIIIGKGGHSRVVRNILNLEGYMVFGYLDDKSSDPEVIGKVIDVGKVYQNNLSLICAIGDNNTREKVVKFVCDQINECQWINTIHPFSSLSTDLKIGVGNMISPGVVIQPSVKIGNHNIINTNSSIDHDCMIGDFTHIAPGVTICGTVIIGDRSFVGAGSVIINNIKIGKRVMIGAGSNVVNDLPDNCVAYGNPCKVIRFIREE